MEENNQAEFQIEVSATDATNKEHDCIMHQLLPELREPGLGPTKPAKDSFQRIM